MLYCRPALSNQGGADEQRAQSGERLAQERPRLAQGFQYGRLDIL
jgi:hypothetical protein